MDEPGGEIWNAKDLHAESATFEFPPVLPFPLDNIRISPLKPRGSRRNRWDFPPSILPLDENIGT